MRDEKRFDMRRETGEHCRRPYRGRGVNERGETVRRDGAREWRDAEERAGRRQSALRDARVLAIGGECVARRRE
jgi:hypothetical protein